MLLEVGWSVAALRASAGLKRRGGRARTSLTPRLLLWPEPKFIKVFWIPESENPDDDKIYFFFRESAVEATPALGRLSVSRVGQICRVRPSWATFRDSATAPLRVGASPLSPPVGPCRMT